MYQQQTNTRPLLLGVFLFVIVAVIAGGIYFYLQYRHAQELLNNPSLLSELQVQDITAKVGKLMDLPSDEFPTVATVSDISKLKNQPFFKNAKNGDQVLIFTKAKIAILYDPARNKIVTVAPLTIGQPSPVQLRVVVYNGTESQSFETTSISQLSHEFSNISIVTTAPANKLTYKKTLVVDLTGVQSQAAAQLASFLQGSVASTLPFSEKTPQNADVVIILGR